MPHNEPLPSGAKIYWDRAPAPCERAGEFAGTAMTGAAAVGATATGVAMIVTQAPVLHYFRQPISGVFMGCCVVANFGYYAAKFTGKVLDGTIGVTAVAFNMGMFQHFNEGERRKIFAAQLYLSRYLLVIPDQELRKLCLRIMEKYHGKSYGPSNASKELIRQLEASTSYQTKLRHLLAYSDDTDNTGRNLAYVIGNELMRFHEEVRQATSDDAMEQALAQRLEIPRPVARTTQQAAATSTLALSLCPLGGIPMTQPVQIAEAKGGDGRAYDLLSLIAHVEKTNGAKLLGAHGKYMDIDFAELQVHHTAFNKLQAYYEEQSAAAAPVSLTLAEANVLAKIEAPVDGQKSKAFLARLGF